MISPYLREIRKKIGHDMVLMPSAAVLVWDEQQQNLLLVLNKETGLWQTIGGGMDPDEVPEDAARREALEEAGVEVEITGLRDVVGGPCFRIIYPNEDEVAYVSVVYDAHIVGGEIKPDDEETVDVKWWPREELASVNLDDFARKLFDMLNI